MADRFDKRMRSEVMSRVARRDTPQEIAVRKFLFSHGFRFRKNVKTLPGSPDIVLPRYKIVIFVNGCFWHGHECKAGALPKSNNEFWHEKITTNKKRDKAKNDQLHALGWKVLTVWQCDLTGIEKTAKRLNRLLKEIEV